jgi:hypothetical protein
MGIADGREREKDEKGEVRGRERGRQSSNISYRGR